MSTGAVPVLINDATRPGLGATLRELWQFRELIAELSKRSLQLRYKNSVLGVAWSLAAPLMMIFAVTVVTKRVMGQNIPNYSAYLFPVMFAWSFFAMAIPDLCTTLLEHAPMIRKVYFPRELLPITVVISNLFHLLVALGLAMIYLIALRIFPQQVNWEVLLLLLIVPAQCLVILGIGLIVSCLNVLFEDVRYIVTVVMQLTFYAVPVLYPIERVVLAAQTGAVAAWLPQVYLLNPFAAVLVLYQKALLPPIQNAGMEALPFSWALLGQTWAVALALLGLGMAVFGRFKWTAVERL